MCACVYPTCNGRSKKKNFLYLIYIVGSRCYILLEGAERGAFSLQTFKPSNS